jgi:hypothetical protein
MRLAHIENGIVINVIVSDVALDGFIESDTANIGDAHNGTAFVPPAIIPVVSTTPNPSGFIQAIKNGLGGIVAANSVAVAYPLFFAAVQEQHWPDVQALLVDAKTKNLLTTQQYADIKTAAATFNIPVTL